MHTEPHSVREYTFLQNYNQLCVLNCLKTVLWMVAPMHVCQQYALSATGKHMFNKVHTWESELLWQPVHAGNDLLHHFPKPA